MLKPEHIDPALCTVKDFLPNDKDHHQIYKETVHMEYWWGVLELAGGFDHTFFVMTDNDDLPYQVQRELSYLQLLHYTVFIKLAGAHYQIEHMQRHLLPEMIERYSFEHRAFIMKEGFDALHSDLYQSVTALTNQLYILIHRADLKPVKVDEKKQISMAPSDMLYWLKINKHKHLPTIKAILLKCERCLDIRHHITHYGVIPVYRDPESGGIFMQKEFHMGGVLSKYDLQAYHYGGGPMVSVIEASEKRLRCLEDEINNLYRYMFRSGVIEDYFRYRGIVLRDIYQPYWVEAAH